MEQQASNQAKKVKKYRKDFCAITIVWKVPHCCGEMNKDIEQEYLENILASSRDMVSALDAIAAQFRSMEKASQGMFLRSINQKTWLLYFKTGTLFFR